MKTTVTIKFFKTDQTHDLPLSTVMVSNYAEGVNVLVTVFALKV